MRMHTTMRRGLAAASVMSIATVASAGSVTISDAISGLGFNRNRHTISLKPTDSNPVTIEGWIDLGGLPHNSAIMIGLLDSSTVGSANPLGNTDTGAWGYFSFLQGGPGDRYRVGASDGGNAGEYIGGGTYLMAADYGGNDTPSIISFTLIIDSSSITFIHESFSETRSYTDDEFPNGAHLFVDAWFAGTVATSHDYELTIRTVPLPSAVGFGGAGLAMLGLVGRRRR